MARWDRDPFLFADDIMLDAHKLQRAIAITILNNLQLLSPVDTGRYRSNHVVSFGAPDGRYSDTIGGMSVAFDAIQGLTADALPTIYIQNNLPYASVIEYGTYPSPVKKGTYIGNGKYEIRSSGGYSKQAPQGVYSLAFEAVVAAFT